MACPRSSRPARRWPGPPASWRAAAARWPWMPNGPPGSVTASAPFSSSSAGGRRVPCSSTRLPAPTCPGSTPRSPRSKPCCTPRDRICPAWPSLATGRGRCLTPSWLAGCSATRGWAWPRWWKRCSACGWPRGTARKIGSTRPLPAEWIQVTRPLDVEVLVELRDALAGELEEQGKAEWGREEFAAVLAARPPGPRPDPWRRTSGIHRVHSRRGLAVVREALAGAGCDSQAAETCQPGRVLSDAAIVEAARALPSNADELMVVLRVHWPRRPQAHPGVGWPPSAGPRPSPRRRLPRSEAGRRRRWPASQATTGGPSVTRRPHGGGWRRSGRSSRPWPSPLQRSFDREPAAS